MHAAHDLIEAAIADVDTRWHHYPFVEEVQGLLNYLYRVMTY